MEGGNVAGRLSRVQTCGGGSIYDDQEIGKQEAGRDNTSPPPGPYPSEAPPPKDALPSKIVLQLGE